MFKIAPSRIAMILPKNTQGKFEKTRNIFKFKAEVLQAVIDGKIGVDDAEKLIKSTQEQTHTNSQHTPAFIFPDDPIEASRVYQEFMKG